MRAEDLLVHDAAPTELRKRLDYGPGITGIRHSGDATREAVGDATTRGLEKLPRCALLFHRPQVPYPRGEIILRHLALESGELEMGMGVDKARQDGGLGKVFPKALRRGRDASIRANGDDAAALIDEQGTVSDGLTENRVDPRSTQPPRRGHPTD
jgi:hypothetical protein